MPKENVRIGAWGGAGGQPRDVQHTPSRLAHVAVRSGEAINNITFYYLDTNGKQYKEGPWGGHGGKIQPGVELDDDEYVKEISGTYGKVGNMARIVQSLKIVTNNGETYEYGRPGTEGSFHVPVNDGQIVSFFGRAGDYLDAIGIYVHP